VKLQAGEYVSLAKVETMLKMCPLVDNLCLYADSSKMYTVCLVVPNQKHVQALAKTLGITASEWPFLCENPLIEAAVLKALQNQGVKGETSYLDVELWIDIQFNHFLGAVSTMTFVAGFGYLKM